MQMKGQVSLELLITLGVILAFSLPVIFLLLSVSQVGYESSSLLQADASARIFADALDSVYFQGKDARRRVSINVPSSTEMVIIYPTEVVVRIKTSDGYYDGVAPFSAKVSQQNYNEELGGVLYPYTGPFVAELIVFELQDGTYEVDIVNPNDVGGVV